MTRNGDDPGGCSPGPSEDTTPAGRESTVIVGAGADGGPIDEGWLRRHGRLAAADERARQMRIARAGLDRLLYHSAPPAGHWECPGEFGPDGCWMPHCGDAA